MGEKLSPRHPFTIPGPLSTSAPRDLPPSTECSRHYPQSAPLHLDGLQISLIRNPKSDKDCVSPLLLDVQTSMHTQTTIWQAYSSFWKAYIAFKQPCQGYSGIVCRQFSNRALLLELRPFTCCQTNKGDSSLRTRLYRLHYVAAILHGMWLVAKLLIETEKQLEKHSESSYLVCLLHRTDRASTGIKSIQFQSSSWLIFLL